jgi:hypothetical protein
MRKKIPQNETTYPKTRIGNEKMLNKNDKVQMKDHKMRNKTVQNRNYKLENAK